MIPGIVAKQTAGVAPGPVVILLTTVGAGSFVIPSDWGAPYSIQAIGAGGFNNGVYFGDGGDWVKITDATGPSFTPGASIPYSIGDAGKVSNSGAGEDTWFDSTATVLAKGGGSTSTSVGEVIHAGGAGLFSGGCGGAGGPYGAGIGARSGGYGGAGDANHGGAGGSYYTSGGDGTEWGGTGSGGGGGFGGAGGLLGGGGGAFSGGTGGIRIEYTPA